MTELMEKKALVSAGEDDVRQYLSEIRQYPLLTREEELILARRCAQGDEEAICRMVNSNLRLVVSVAREYAGRGVALLDLIQEGSIGLLAAARKFDYTMDTRFSTYATKRIRQGVTRCLMNHNGMIRVPLHTGDKIRKVEKARSELQRDTGQVPTLAQIAARAELSESKTAELLELMPDVCSLDVPVGEEDSLGTLLEDSQAPKPYEALVRRELKQTLEQLMSQLNERQQEILRLHFGMEGDCCSLDAIGKRLGISKERVRQIEQQAIEKLQKNGADFGLEDFLNE